MENKLTFPLVLIIYCSVEQMATQTIFLLQKVDGCNPALGPACEGLMVTLDEGRQEAVKMQCMFSF